MSKEIEDIGAPSRKILQAFVLWGHETCSYKRLENSPTFSCGVILYFQQITFKLGSFTNFKTFFPAVLTDFR